jgi:hypothetical protein
MRWNCLALVLALAGCNYGTPIHLKNIQTGEVAVCGPYPYAGSAAADEQTCLQKAQQQGFTVTPQN